MELDVENEYNGHQTGYSGGTLYLYFKTATMIEANKPYIIKWDVTGGARGTEVTELMAPNFCDSNLEGIRRAPHKASGTTDITSKDGYVTFRGTFVPVEIGPNDENTILYLGDENQLYYPTETMTIGAFKAYFVLNGEHEAREFVLNFDDDHTTGINSTTNLTNYTNSAGAWFDLSGRKLNAKPTHKGVYINNGRKVVIK